MCGNERSCAAYSCRLRNREGRICCDGQNCCSYSASCRNPYWPEFAHPRWLACADLYDGNQSSCYENDDNDNGCCCG